MSVCRAVARSKIKTPTPRVQEVSAGASEGSRRHRRRRRGRDYDASSLISLFVPISLCMLLVVVTVNTVASSYAAPPRRHACVSLPSVSRAAGKSAKSRQLAEEKLAKIAVKSRRSIFVVIYCPQSHREWSSVKVRGALKMFRA